MGFSRKVAFSYTSSDPVVLSAALLAKPTSQDPGCPCEGSGSDWALFPRVIWEREIVFKASSAYVSASCTIAWLFNA